MWCRVPSSVSAQGATQLAKLTGDAAQRRHVFPVNCDEGPDLYHLHRSDARIRAVITAGIKSEMPSFGKILGDPDVRQLIAYLRTLDS
jgi:hypothetical protein